MEQDAYLNIRLPTAEKQILNDYCKRVNRGKTDVLREFIRSLEGKG
jgi:predicted DNA-binding protein